MIRRRPVFSMGLGTVAGILILASGCAESPTSVEPVKAAPSNIGNTAESLKPGSPSYGQFVLATN